MKIPEGYIEASEEEMQTNATFIDVTYKAQKLKDIFESVMDKFPAFSFKDVAFHYCPEEGMVIEYTVIVNCEDEYGEESNQEHEFSEPWKYPVEFFEGYLYAQMEEIYKFYLNLK